MESMESKRLEELATRVARSGRTHFSRFLEPTSLGLARAAAGKAGVNVYFYGGYADAERQIASFSLDESPSPEDYPFVPLRLSWNSKYVSPGHRDLLGAAMGLGLERNMTGDVVMGEYHGMDCAYLFVMPEAADYIVANLKSAGRAPLKAQRADEMPLLKPPEGTHIRVTVQNERMDAVLAAGYRLSRSEAQKLISAGLVKLNHSVQLKGDFRIQAGDLISARGYGRLKVQEIQGETRKGRQGLLLFKYGNQK